jgi:hypothetical protein
MKAVLAACVAFGAISFAALPQAHADDVRVPGVHVDVGDRDHAREHRDWDRHADNRMEEHRERVEHCVGRACDHLTEIPGR